MTAAGAFETDIYASSTGAIQVLGDGDYLRLRIIGWDGDDGSPNSPENGYYLALST